MTIEQMKTASKEFGEFETKLIQEFNIDFNSQIGKIMIDYAVRTKELDKILNELGTRDYCAKECRNGSIGCCSGHPYKSEVSRKTLMMQEIEALKNGWLDKDTKKNVCKYHTSSG
ncbi:unnamed protein product [marine sediment metagenome]|uniref:Uncharacterized protein n=1 Tax=marine sediment metagenome TaxID=412755 RepID=X1TA35_9ZZZZ